MARLGEPLSTRRTVVLAVGGLHWATSEATVQTALLRRPGVMSVDANAANTTATVTYDPSRTSVAELSKWVRDCGFHCAGRSVPEHMCDPMLEPGHHGHAGADDGEAAGHAPRE